MFLPLAFFSVTPRLTGTGVFTKDENVVPVVQNVEIQYQFRRRRGHCLVIAMHCMFCCCSPGRILLTPSLEAPSCTLVMLAISFSLQATPRSVEACKSALKALTLPYVHHSRRCVVIENAHWNSSCYTRTRHSLESKCLRTSRLFEEHHFIFAADGRQKHWTVPLGNGHTTGHVTLFCIFFRSLQLHEVICQSTRCND